MAKEKQKYTVEDTLRMARLTLGEPAVVACVSAKSAAGTLDCINICHGKLNVDEFASLLAKLKCGLEYFGERACATYGRDEFTKQFKLAREREKLTQKWSE